MPKKMENQIILIQYLGSPKHITRWGV